MNVRTTRRLLVAIAMSLLGNPVWSQEATVSTPADPKITAVLREISAERIQASITKLVSFGNRSTLSAQDAKAIAAGRGIGAAREWIKSELERYSRDCGGCLEVKTDAFIQPPVERVKEPTQLTNVYAVLKGTDPQAHTVLVSGHYDSRNSDNFDITKDAPGANDDASGTAVSLECARVLSRMKFPQTVIFLAVPGEEQGLLGSKHLAQIAKQQGWRLDAVLNNDIVGGNKGEGQDPTVVRVFSEGIPRNIGEQELRTIEGLGGENDSTSRELARYISETAYTYHSSVKPMMIFRLDRYLRGGDHSSFNAEGFAAVRFTEYREDYTRQHQDIRTENGISYGDTLDHVDFDYVANVTRINAATLAALASAPPAPTNVKLEVVNLDNDSTLTWDSSPGASDFEIIWRSTSSPQWEHAQKTGGATHATVKVSKDNVIFGVRALDRSGHASLPVMPVPARGG